MIGTIIGLGIGVAGTLVGLGIGLVGTGIGLLISDKSVKYDIVELTH